MPQFQKDLSEGSTRHGGRFRLESRSIAVMSTMPLTSVIIATHNRPHLLPNAVASAQRAGDEVEVVVVDDASSDETKSVCRTLRGIKYVRLDRNQGVAGARNVGLVESTGEYCSFLDDDDVRHPGSLNQQIQILESNSEVGLVYGQASIAANDGTPTDDVYPSKLPRGKIFWELVQQNFIPCASAVFRRSCLTKVGLLDHALPGIDDWDLWLRISVVFSIEAVEQPVMTWRKSDPNSRQVSSHAARMVTLATQQFHTWMKLPEAAAATPQQRRAAWAAFSENIAAHLLWDAGRAMRIGNGGRAMEDVWRAFLDHPRGVLRLARNRRSRLAGRSRGRQLSAVL